MGKKRNFSINIKNSWDKITLKDFLKIQEYYKDNKQPTIFQLLTVLSDKTEDELKEMPLEVINEISKQLEFLSDVPSKLTSNKIVIDNEEYIIGTENELKFGEWVEVNKVTDIPSKLAIICRKQNEPYDTEFEQHKLIDRIELFSNQPITKIYPLISFFLNSWIVSTVNTNTFISSAQVSLRYFIKQWQNSMKTSVTTHIYTRLLLTMILLKWRLSDKCILLKYSIISYTKSVSQKLKNFKMKWMKK